MAETCATRRSDFAEGAADNWVGAGGGGGARSRPRTVFFFESNLQFQKFQL